MKILKFILFTIFILVIFLFCQNNLIQITNIQINPDNLPKGFDGYRIAHLSDLHGKVFFKNNSVLIRILKSLKPDLIVITGDFIDAGYYDEAHLLSLADEIIKIAPVYYVTGNHELATKKFPAIEKKLKEKGINILRGSSAWIERNGDEILLLCVEDPKVTSQSESEYSRKSIDKQLNKLISINEKDAYKILLSHRPEQFHLYTEYGIDLTFTGHAHGGQIRIPFLGGLYAPGQGLFPEYYSGKYTIGNSTMIVSRGLGNASIPQRIFNRPEIIITTLHKK